MYPLIPESAAEAAESVPGWMDADELLWLANKASAADRILEIGCWKGRSTLALASASPGSVLSVDHFCGSPEDEGHAEARERPGAVLAEAAINLGPLLKVRKVSLMVMECSGAMTLLRMGGRRFDLIFIDGSHLYARIASDIAGCMPLLSPGGLLCGHDYGDDWPDVRKAVSEAGGEPVGVGSLWRLRR